MLPLYASSLALVPLGSGSKGNATYVGDGRRGVLIDCGLSALQVFKRLEAVGLGGSTIDAVLITHEHTDHVAAAAILDRKLEAAQGRQVPFYMTQGTFGRLSDSHRPRQVEVVPTGARIAWQGWTLEAHAIPHDTPEPVAWAVESDGARVGVITDLGHAPRLMEQLLASLDVAVVEFNHDLQMLMDGSYPWSLKQRIRGRHGHLSNDQAGELLVRGASSRLKHLILGHLSEENNAPDEALRAAEQAVQTLGRTDVTVHVAEQTSACGPFRVSARPHAVSTPTRRPRAAANAPAEPELLSLWDAPPLAAEPAAPDLRDATDADSRVQR